MAGYYHEDIFGSCCEWDADRRLTRMATDDILESTRIEEPEEDCCGPVSPYPVLELISSSQQTMYQAYKGQLCVSVYINCGLITVHVIQARHLSSASGQACSAYVKLSLVPDASRRTHCRTDVIRGSNHPLWDEKFSLELLDEDSRLFISVWNQTQDPMVSKKKPSKQRSELLGCMSFGIAGILHRQEAIRGWHYLLSEHVGIHKRLAVDPAATTKQASSMSSSSATSAAPHHLSSSYHMACHSSPSSTANSSRSRLSAKDSRSSLKGSRSSLGNRSTASSAGSSLAGGVIMPSSSVSLQDLKCMQQTELLIPRGATGYGLSLVGGHPAVVSRVKVGSPADLAGVKVGDCVVRVCGERVHRMSSQTVGRIIKHFPDYITLQVCRPWKVSQVTSRPVSSLSPQQQSFDSDSDSDSDMDNSE